MRVSPSPARARGVALGLLLLAAAACAPASERPARGAPPGAERPTPTSAVPPTLTVGDPSLVRLPSPSPGLAGITASPSAVASPSPNPQPPIVRTILPAANATVPRGAPVTVQAVVVGRGADLGAASLTVNGVDVGAEVERASTTQWTLRASLPLAPGGYTARVLVNDVTGARGGFTWQFTVGDPPTPTPDPAAPAEEPTATPPPRPPTPRPATSPAPTRR